MESPPLQMAALQNGDNHTVCTDMAVPTVTSLPYRMAQTIHILLSLFTIVFTVFAYFQLKKKFYFHHNIRILMTVMFVSANVLATQMLIMQIRHLIASFTFTSPCDVFISARTCFPYFITNGMAIACMTGVQVCMCVERLVATHYMDRYEKMGGTLAYTMTVTTVAVFSLLFWRCYWDDPLDEAFLTCISIPTRAAKQANLTFVLLIVCNLFSIVSLIAINIANRRCREKLRYNLANRYQVEENIASTEYICIVIFVQFVIFTFYGVFTLVLRAIKSRMEEKVQRTMIMFAYSVPYFTCVLPLLLIWIVKRGVVKRGRRINKMLSATATGEVGRGVYFEELLKQWA